MSVTPGSSGRDRANRRGWAAALAAVPVLLAIALTGNQISLAETTSSQAAPPETRAPAAVIPQPVSHVPGQGPPFELAQDSSIVVRKPSDPETRQVAEQLADMLRPSTGFELPVAEAAGRGSFIELTTKAPAGLGPEGYRLRTTGPHRLVLEAHEPEGLFRGMQTLRQLLPPEIEAPTTQAGPWRIEPVDITDHPRFGYRAVMLDVARRFVEAEDVKRFIDQAAKYKVNVFHWHITDDQGWRIPIQGIPELTTIGGSTQSGWSPEDGGPWYYTPEEYEEIIDYAAERYITVVPEIDGPGHVHAALSSVPELNCDDTSPPPYYGFDVRVSAFCLEDEKHVANVYEFIDTVFTETAAMSPGPFLHIGGDEVEWLTDEQYNGYIETAGDIATGLGKRVVGWHDIGVGPLPPDSVIQYWGTGSDRNTIGTPNESRNIREVRAGLEQGAQVLISPADRTYLDMKYDAATPYGLQWAGHTTIERAYDWDPMTILARPDGMQSLVGEDDVIGVEAPLWTDRAYENSLQLPTSLDQFPDPPVYMDFMTFPRLPAVAEIGWSPRESRQWEDFRHRLAAQGERWDQQDIGYYRSPEIDWDLTERVVSTSLPDRVVYDGTGRASVPVEVTNRSMSVANDVRVRLDLAGEGVAEPPQIEIARLAVGDSQTSDGPWASAAELSVDARER